MRPMPFLGPSASTSASASVPVALQLPLRRRLGDLDLQLPLRRRLGDPEAAIWAVQRTSSLKIQRVAVRDGQTCHRWQLVFPGSKRADGTLYFLLPLLTPYI